MDHDRRNDLREDDASAHRPSSPRDPHAAQLRGRIQVHAHGLDRGRRNGAAVCTGRDWSATLQWCVHRRDRHGYGANARREGNQCGRRGELRYDRTWVRARVDGRYALDW
jgi:hypothetical protein